jgi:hypothetical protein
VHGISKLFADAEIPLSSDWRCDGLEIVVQRRGRAILASPVALEIDGR